MGANNIPVSYLHLNNTHSLFVFSIPLFRHTYHTCSS